MRIVLADINFRPPFDPITGRNSHECLALKYLGACAVKAGHTVRIVDAQFRDLSSRDALNEVCGFRPDLVGLSLTDWVLEEACSWVKEIRRKAPEAHLTAGGPGASAWPAELLARAPELDSVVVGEGEATFCELFECLTEGRPWQGLLGILCRDDRGLVKRNAPRPFISDLDTLPLPLREERYPLDSATLSASRGCYMKCTFCDIVSYSEGQSGRPVRFRQPSAILDEMETLYRVNGVRWFNFVDDIFTGINRLQKGWVEEIADGILKRGMKIGMFCESRVDDVNRDMLLKLKAAGLRTIAMGVETGQNDALNRYKKGATRDQNMRTIRLVQELNIHYELFSILVDADSTPASMLETIDFFAGLGYLQQNDPVPFSVQAIAFRAYPFRQSGLYQEYRRRNILRERGFSIFYELLDPTTQRVTNACVELHARIGDALRRMLAFRYVTAIQSGNLRAAVVEKRFGNHFLQADLAFMRKLLGRLVEEPKVFDHWIQDLVTETAHKINEISRSVPASDPESVKDDYRWNRGHVVAT